MIEVNAEKEKIRMTIVKLSRNRTERSYKRRYKYWKKLNI